MKNLLETNIYDAKGKVMVCGTCLPNMEPDAYNRIAKKYDCVLSLCLEKEHINMAITKICGMLSCNKITELAFVSVNKSPHCTQLHYIKNEIKIVMNNDNLPVITNIIVENNNEYVMTDEVLAMSKNLVELSNILNG